MLHRAKGIKIEHDNISEDTGWIFFYMFSIVETFYVIREKIGLVSW